MAGVKKGSVRDNATPVQVWLPNDTHHLFKILCTIDGVKMSEKAHELIEQWIEASDGGKVIMKTISDKSED